MTADQKLPGGCATMASTSFFCLQGSVMRAAFALLDEPSGPVLVDYPEDIFAERDFNLAQAASVPAPALPPDVAFELTALRPYYEQLVQSHAGRTAVSFSVLRPPPLLGLLPPRLTSP